MLCGKPFQIVFFRGSRSRNKVCVGEPAQGSLERDRDILEWKNMMVGIFKILRKNICRIMK